MNGLEVSIEGLAMHQPAAGEHGSEDMAKLCLIYDTRMFKSAIYRAVAICSSQDASVGTTRVLCKRISDLPIEKLDENFQRRTNVFKTSIVS